MNSDLISRAIAKPTLLDAIAFVCLWDTDRAVRQAVHNSTPGLEKIATHHDGALYDTCTTHLIREVIKAWDQEYPKTHLVSAKDLLTNSYLSTVGLPLKCEIRKVPVDWQHPKDKEGNYIPMFHCFTIHERFYQLGVEAISKGKVPGHSDFRRGIDLINWVDKTNLHTPRDSFTLEEWIEEKLPLESFMFKDSTTLPCTHFQLYEIISEGTPISPIFETVELLNHWRKQHTPFKGGILSEPSTYYSYSRY